MAKEIERKFLIDPSHPEVLALMKAPPMVIEQGYIMSEAHGVVRVRRIGDRGFLTIKGAIRGIERDEFEYEIPLNDALEMLSRLCPTSLRKERRILDLEGGLVAEVDFFPRIDLFIAEVELPSADAGFPQPEWFLREVSENPEYFNNEIARRICATQAP